MNEQDSNRPETSKSPPISGMKTIPMGLPLMMGAWLGCLEWAIQEPDVRKRFEKEVGYSLDSLVKANPLDRLIDAATGYERTVVLSFIDWVTKNIWGEE